MLAKGDINMCNIYDKPHGHRWTTCAKCGEKLKACEMQDTGEEKKYIVCGPCYVIFRDEVVINV